ncbi:MAG: hypothetical protein BGO70_09560 [Bacteroidetes bacterium 43-93]|mgnify:CR=1 FL=1|nr:hypothetical protein [Bacteroidota bacterium]OJX00406.1 MAG: hypothetical protein BGO70_09560 [Bacteroidetes bacterium 43-93]
MRLFIAVLLAGLIYSCTQSHKRSTYKVDTYPRLIDSLSLRKYYDDGKWLMSCYYCDDTVIPDVKNKGLIPKNITYGELKVKPIYIKLIGSDTLELNFAHFYNDTVLCSYQTIRSHLTIWGLAYDIKHDSVLYYANEIMNLTEWCPSPCGSRLGNPIQPEVVKYIESHRDVLDPWFKAEAIKRKVLK